MRIQRGTAFVDFLKQIGIEKAGVADIECGGKKTRTDIYLTTADAITKYNAVAIDQIYRAVGADLAEYLARVRIENSVQCDSVAIRLLEDHLISAADVETRPVENLALQTLINGAHRTAGVGGIGAATAAESRHRYRQLRLRGHADGAPRKQ